MLLAMYVINFSDRMQKGLLEECGFVELVEFYYQ